MSDKKDENTFLNNMRESPLSTIIRAFRHGQFITSMRLILYLIISCRFFGVCTQALRKLRFWGERFIFHKREKLEDKHLTVGAVISILRSGCMPILLSFIFVIGIYWLSLSVNLPASFRNIIELLLPKQIKGFFTLDTTIYIALFTTIAAITGVFLALYFTTLSLVAISYSEPQHREIRNLVIKNAVSSGFLFLSAHLGAITLFGLALLAIGFPPSFFLMAYVLFIAVVVIFSFLLVGRRIFQFFDPRELARTPKANFLKSVKRATITGARSNQPPFQRHFRDQALYELHRLECLIEFALSQSASQSTRGEIVRDLCITLLNIFNRCVTDSSKIPNLSMWFPRKRVFQKWGFTSSIQTDIAMRTGTTPQPEEKPDYLFVCNAISRMVRQSIQSLIKAGDYSDASAILIGSYHTMGQLGENLAIDEARHLLSEVRDVLFSDDNGMRVVEANDRSQAMSMASAYGTCILNLAISASENLERRTVDEILDSYYDLRFQSTKQLYKRKHPREVLRHLEEFHQKLAFERKTEGRICSSDWFLREHLARRYADFIWHLSEQLVQCVTDFCLQPVEKLMEPNLLWPNAELLRSSIETTKKVKFRITALSELHQKLAKIKVTKEDWINAEFVTLEQKLQSVESELLGNVANVAHKLTSDTNIGEFPDYAGIFRAYLGDALVSRMERQDVNQFETLFAGIFKTTFGVASHHIGAKDEHFSEPHKKIALDTIIDLLDLSGLALLFSELHGSSFFKIVAKEWDAYFDVCPNGKFAIQFFYGSIDMVLQLPALSPSGTGRFNWERTFIRAMANAGFDIEGRMSPWEGEEKARTEHTSRIIQSIRPHMGMTFRRPYDYFAAFYLSKRAEAEGIKLPNGVLECKEAVDREERQRVEGNGS
jgi:hypothetical protein